VIRLGLIGCGKWGWVYAKSAREAGNCKVTHVHRVSEKHFNDAWVQDFLMGAKIVDRWEDMLQEPIDAFCVATPPGTHAEICNTLIRHGRPVMVEKPMTLSVLEAVRLQSLLQSTDVPFLVDHVHLFNPSFLRLRELLAEARPDKVVITSRGGNEGPYRDGYSALWDYAPHDLSMCLALGIGVPTSVSSTWSPQESSDGKAGSHHDLHIEFGRNRAHVQVWNAAKPRTRWFEVASSGIRLTYDDTVLTHGSGDFCQVRHNNVPVHGVDRSQIYPHAHAVHAFAEAVRTGKTDWRFGASDAVTIARICDFAETGTVHA
jgi:predicted dehydrogenase